MVVVTEHTHETVTSSTRKPGDQVLALKIMLLAARPHQCHTETRRAYAKLHNDCGRWPSLASIATVAKLLTTAWVPTW